MTGRLLLVDDDPAFRESTAAILRGEGWEVATADGGEAAVERLAGGRVDLLLLDMRMPGIDGISLVEVLRRRGERLPVLMISGFGTVEGAVRALHAGADDFLTKPIEPDVLTERVRELLARRPVSVPDETSPGGMVGRSPAMLEVYQAIRQVAPTDATVLLSGETGTGKELAARAIHDHSKRAGRPFVAVNCASIPEGVLESELFGHVRGAFTGAVSDRPGLFRAADGGTLLLDEIGDVPPPVQRSLLRVLQEREITPVGTTSTVRVDVRILAATNRELADEARAGRFREDLLYRIDVFRVRLPPLRERPGDVSLLVNHTLEAWARARGDAVPRVAPLAARMLEAYRWPGNVRELLAVLESALIRSGGETVEAEHLREQVRASLPARSREPVADDEAVRIRTALEQADGVRSRAAELLGIGRTTLWRRMKELGIED